MKIFLALLAGLFILSRLQQGQGQGSGGFAAAPAGGDGEIPYGGAAGIIENFLGQVFSGDGGGGLIGRAGVSGSSLAYAPFTFTLNAKNSIPGPTPGTFIRDPATLPTFHHIQNTGAI